MSGVDFELIRAHLVGVGGGGWGWDVVGEGVKCEPLSEHPTR